MRRTQTHVPAKPTHTNTEQPTPYAEATSRGPMPLHVRSASGLTHLLRHAGVFGLFLALGVIAYAPPAGWWDKYYFGIGGDPWIYIWSLHWWPFALHQHLAPLYTRFVDAPIGASLAWKTTLPTFGLLLAPLTATFGALAIYNGLMLASPGLAAWAAYLAAHDMTDRQIPSIFAGLIFGFSTYETAQLIAHLNLAFTALVPLAFWCCLRAAHRGWRPLRLGLALGLLLTLQFGISREIFATSIVFGAILLVIVVMVCPDMRFHVIRLLPGLGIAMMVCLLLTAPFTWQMIRWYGSGTAGLSSPESGSSDLLGFFIPTPITLVGGRSFALLTRHFVARLEEQGSYFGLPLLALTVHIVSKSRTDAAVRCAGLLAACAVLLSLGPFVHVLGFAISTAPWIAVSWLPFLKAMLPIRFVLYAWLAVAMLLARWLAAPDAPRRRYIVAACAILFLMPNPGDARNWTPLHIPDAFAAHPTGQGIPQGSRILILPEWGDALGYQVSSGMRFSLVGQGYLGNGMPQPFARWHLFSSLFNNEFNAIDPAELAAYLGAYRVDFVAVLRPAFVGTRAHRDAAAAAARLLGAAGWQVAWTTADVTVFRPGPATHQPTAGQIAAYMSMPSAGHVAKLIKSETSWVCGIETVARLTGINAAPFLRLYVHHADPPLPAERIRCR